MRKIKILIGGESGVGKTSLIKQYIYKKFNESMRCTVTPKKTIKKIFI